MRKVFAFCIIAVVAAWSLTALADNYSPRQVKSKAKKVTARKVTKTTVTETTYQSTQEDTLPAVSEVNAKISSGYADLDASKTTFGAASVTFPVTHSTGIQIDGIGGDSSADTLWGVGGHFFIRDPNKGMIGIATAHTQIGASSAHRNGLEGALYYDKFTVSSSGGYQYGDVKDTGYVDLDLLCYVNDNFMIGAGVGYADKTVGKAHIEFMPNFKPLPGWSVFADGAFGENDFTTAMAGFRYYFGQEKSLKRRHREDDPPNILLNGLPGEVQGGLGEGDTTPPELCRP